MKDEKKQLRKTTNIPIPSQFRPLIDKEMEEVGCYAITEMMGRILAEHYDNKAKSKPEPSPDAPKSKSGALSDEEVVVAEKDDEVIKIKEDFI